MDWYRIAEIITATFLTVIFVNLYLIVGAFFYSVDPFMGGLFWGFAIFPTCRAIKSEFDSII